MLERNKIGRVLAEYKVLSNIDFPFLCPLYCTISSQHHLHYLLEYCEGGNLYTLIK